jgi:hypothetical protein
VNCYYDDSGQLYRVLDGSGNLAEYVYDPVGSILQVKRSAVAPNMLAILNVAPAHTATGSTITILGQNFSTTPSANVITIGGVQATVLSATATSLTVSVPPNAISGVASITVGGVTASWSGSVVVVPLPVVSTISPIAALAGTTISSLAVTGSNLTGASFSFFGSSANQLAITNVAISPSGTSATVTVALNAAAFGRFVLVASNAAGNSTTISARANTLVVPGSNPNADPDLDGLTNAREIALTTDPLNNDTDGDGFGDGDEVAVGTDPLDPNSFPHFSPAPPTGAQSLSLSVYNATPEISNPQTAPPPESQSLTVSVKNGTTLTLSQLQSLLRQVDSDGDGLPDVVEIALCGTPFCAKPDDDFDGDGLTNLQEVRLGTDPKKADSDGDGLSDGDEVLLYHTDPLNPDTDGDGYTDGEEIAAGTNPLDPTSVPSYPPRKRSEGEKRVALMPSFRKDLRSPESQHKRRRKGDL